VETTPISDAIAQGDGGDAPAVWNSAVLAKPSASETPASVAITAGPCRPDARRM
jgi:hypothetical protein